MILDAMRRLLDEIGDREASTRAIGLVRIGMAIVLLSEWGDALILMRARNPAMVLLGISTILSAIALLVGFRARLAAVWAAGSATAVIAVLGFAADNKNFIHHHTHMMMLALWILALAPCGASYSWDRWRSRAPERGFVWGQRLLVVLVSSVYLWGAHNKLTPGFLSGARLEHHYMQTLEAPLPDSALFHFAMIAASWATIALEVFVAFGLWSRGLRRYAIALGIAFHLVMYYTLEVSTFSAMVIVLYLAALDPDDVHRWIDELQSRPASG